MSLERILKTLEEVGLSHVESEVYIYLAKTGPRKARDLSNGLRMTKQQLYPALKGLVFKGMVMSGAKRATLFSALCFEELLSRYVKINVEQAQSVTDTKQELLESWRKMPAKTDNLCYP